MFETFYIEPNSRDIPKPFVVHEAGGVGRRRKSQVQADPSCISKKIFANFFPCHNSQKPLIWAENRKSEKPFLGAALP